MNSSNCRKKRREAREGKGQLANFTDSMRKPTVDRHVAKNFSSQPAVAFCTFWLTTPPSKTFSSESSCM